MRAAGSQLVLELGGSARPAAVTLDSRRETRERTVRQVELTPFPRVGPDTGIRVGFSRDVSASGMALGVGESLPVGSLLRVLVRTVDGRPDFDAIARVAWCQQDAADAPTGPTAWLGLSLIAEIRRGMARVPRAEHEPVRQACPER